MTEYVYKDALVHPSAREIAALTAVPAGSDDLTVGFYVDGHCPRCHHQTHSPVPTKAIALYDTMAFAAGPQGIGVTYSATFMREDRAVPGRTDDRLKEDPHI